MLGRDFPKKRAKCTTARSSTARSTARPRLTRPTSCTRRGSSFTRCPYCRTSGTDQRPTSTWRPVGARSGRTLLGFGNALIVAQPIAVGLGGRERSLGAGRDRIALVLGDGGEDVDRELGGRFAHAIGTRFSAARPNGRWHRAFVG